MIIPRWFIAAVEKCPQILEDGRVVRRLLDLGARAIASRFSKGTVARLAIKAIAIGHPLGAMLAAYDLADQIGQQQQESRGRRPEGMQ